MDRLRPLLIALAVLLAPPLGAATVKDSGDELTVTLSDDVTLHFARSGEALLGLRSATIDGVAVSSQNTVQRPVLAQEFADGRMMMQLLRYRDAKVVDGAVHVTADVLGVADEQALRSFFVFAGDRKRAMEEGMTDELRKLKQARDKAMPVLMAAVQQQPAYAALTKKLEAQEAVLADVEQKKHHGRAKKQIRRITQQRDRFVDTAIATFDSGEENQRAAHAIVMAWEKAIEARAIELGRIHRDYYRFALTRLPAEICTIEFVRQLHERFADGAKVVGQLTWIIEPHEQNIAGWRWVGWKQRFRIALQDDVKVNVIRVVGTWELDGDAAGTTIVAMRYRGLGGIEQKLTAADDAGVKEAFSTTEVIPGAVGDAPLISPIVPRSVEVNDRGFALRHRAGAWIHKMARGAGSPFVDFQYKPHITFASYPVRQGSLRSLTEVMPGDDVVSQSESEWFALTGRHETIPQVYAAVVTKVQPLAVHESRTRWKEVDQFVRDTVAEELDFVQVDMLPGAGALYDVGWKQHYNALANGQIARFAEQGLRIFTVHNPGWINGRYQGPEGPTDTGGGVCNIYDWWPTTDMVDPWKAFTVACAANNVGYYPWLGQTVWKDAPFARRVGYDQKHWSLNTPFDSHGPGYGAENVKGNILNDHYREQFVNQLDKLWQEFGYNGFWCDSFQNLFMSQLDWAQGTGDSMQRAWWEQIAKWTREGRHWMAESHSFPGWSCSIEIHDWDENPWAMQHVFRWYRGNEMSHFSAEQLESNSFRMMANKAWTAPDVSYGREVDEVMPTFEAHAKQLLAARPMMHRPYLLPDERGVLWLTYDGDGEGVLFSFATQDIPDGVTAQRITDRDADKTAVIGTVGGDHTGGRVVTTAKFMTYHVTADDLLKRFDIRTGGLADLRIGRKWKDVTWTYPGWAVKAAETAKAAAE